MSSFNVVLCIQLRALLYCDPTKNCVSKTCSLPLSVIISKFYRINFTIINTFNNGVETKFEGLFFFLRCEAVDYTTTEIDR